MSDVVIQSFYPYTMEFHIKEGKVIIPPASMKPKNIVILKKEYAEQLEENDTFKSLMGEKLYRYLDKVPNSYYDSMEQIARAQSQLVEARTEAERSKADAEASRKLAEKLKAQLEDLGGATKSTDAKVLEAQAEAEKNRKDYEDAQSEIASLKAQLDIKRGRPAKAKE